MLLGLLVRLRKRYSRGPQRMGYRVRAHLPMNLGYLPGLWWLVSWVCSHVTILGGSLAFLVFATGGYASYYGRAMPISYAYFVMVGLLMVDFVAGLLLLPRVSILRQCPARAMAGGNVDVDVAIRNMGRLAVRRATVDALPLPSDTRLHSPRPRVALLLPGEEVACRYRLMFRRRGVFVLPQPRVTFEFPFGAWVWGRYGEGARRISVHPAFAPLEAIESGLGVRPDTSGERVVDQNAVSMEFFGCRDYREGDNPRHIHPRSWARVGYPVVKEFQDECRLRTALVVDTGCRATLQAWARGHDPLFEAGMSLSAAVAEWLARNDHLIELFAAGKGIYRFTSEGRVGFLPELLDILAALDPQRGEPLGKLLPALEADLVSIQSVLLILLRWDAARARAIEELRGRGVLVKPVLIVREAADAPRDADCQVVLADDVLQGRCAKL